MPINSAAQGLPAIGTIGSLSLGTVQIEPSLKVGYQHVTQNINLPIPFSGVLGPELFTASGLDFALQDANVWIGGVRVDARRGPYSLFLSAEGNASKSVRVSTPSEPFWAGFEPVEWRGSRRERWNLGGGGSLDICRNVAVVGGLKAEHLSLGLADAVDPTGAIQFFQATYGDRYSGDLSTSFGCPTSVCGSTVSMPRPHSSSARTRGPT